MEAWDIDHILAINGICLLGVLNHCKEIKTFLKCIDKLRKGDRKTCLWLLHPCALCRAACLSHPRLVGMRDPLDLIHYVLCVFLEREQKTVSLPVFIKPPCF